MKIILNYNTKVKQNDIGDVFEIRWVDGSPTEFTFDDDTLVYFIARHLTLPANNFRAQGVIDPTNKIGKYVMQTGDAAVIGEYEFEFEFKDAGTTYRQTYPKAEAVTYEVVEELD